MTKLDAFLRNNIVLMSSDLPVIVVAMFILRCVHSEVTVSSQFWFSVLSPSAFKLNADP